MQNWENEFDELIGRPVSGERIKEFIRNLLKQNEENSAKKEIKD